MPRSARRRSTSGRSTRPTSSSSPAPCSAPRSWRTVSGAWRGRGSRREPAPSPPSWSQRRWRWRPCTCACRSCCTSSTTSRPVSSSGRATRATAASPSGSTITCVAAHRRWRTTRWVRSATTPAGRASSISEAWSLHVPGRRAASSWSPRSSPPRRRATSCAPGDRTPASCTSQRPAPTVRCTPSPRSATPPSPSTAAPPTAAGSAESAPRRAGADTPGATQLLRSPASMTSFDAATRSVVARLPGRDEPVEVRWEAGAFTAVETAALDGVPPGEATPWIVPGLIDLQVNGAAGFDLTSEPGAIDAVAAELPRWGVTSFLATLITAPAQAYDAAIAAIARCADSGRGVATTEGRTGTMASARPLGLHFEGPYLSPEYPGTHPVHHLRSPEDAGELAAGWRADRGVRLVTLAPELPGAASLIERLCGDDVVVAAGHTAADDELLHDAAGRGVSLLTHAFNAMAPLHHRRPGAVAAALLDERLRLSLIVDGVHVHPEVVRLVWRLAGPDRVILISDATAALGGAPGAHRLGEVDLEVEADVVRNRDGGLAGTQLPLTRALRNLMRFTDCPLAEALRTVTDNPARLLGLPPPRIEVGAPADFVLLDAELEPIATWVGGAAAYPRADAESHHRRE
ncbi:MAG: hypothetical protein DWQ30_04980 [Acidobacteria bacterium]|nr:MAG: hypothetical protein DWQ30_04980 [Acidobacteriota bacterium]